MMTRRMSLVTLAGLVGTVLAIGSTGLPGSALAQVTKSEVKEKAKAAAKRAHVKWESLTPEQQEHLKEILKQDAQKAQEKWNAMTPEQQQKVVAKARAGGKKAKEKWQSLPQ